MKAATIRDLTILGTAAFLLASAIPVFAETTTACTEETEWETTTSTTEVTYTAAETAPPVNALRFEVKVVNDETSELFPNVNVRLEKWYYSLNIPPATGHEEYYTGEIEVMESWNTSDANPYLSGTYEYTPEKPFDVFAVIDEVPAGYSFDGQESGRRGWTYVKAGSETYGCTIRLKPEKYYFYENFPITGTYTQRIRVIDTFTKEPIPDLECAVINTDSGEEIYRWNTSEEPVAVVSGLEYRFEDWKMKNTVPYIVKILNMPEGYIMNFMDLEDYKPIYYWGVWYDEGLTEIDRVIELYNTNPDAPQGTMITTTTTDTTTVESDTDTTASTTASVTLTAESTTSTATTSTVTITTTVESDTDTTASTTASVTLTAESTTSTATTSTVTITDLPQTGDNNPARLLAVLSALVTAGAGAALLALRRKETL